MRPHRRSRFLSLALAVLVASAVGGRLAPRAQADADPPSDLLVGGSVYYPYTPPVATSLQAALARELARLQRRGLNLKVALIATKVDLGAIPELFGKPQTYANFLAGELAFNGPQPLLVVMPDGFGLAHAGPPGALEGSRVDARHGADGLARSAILAVLRIARAVGKPMSAGAIPSATGAPTGQSSALIPAVVGALAVVAIAASCALDRRRGRRRRLATAPGPVRAPRT